MYDTNLLLGKKLTREDALKGLEAALKRLQALTFDHQSLEEALRNLAAELGLKTGDFFGLLRVATTGRTAAPPLFQTMAALGKERCLKSIETALKKLRLDVDNIPQVLYTIITKSRVLDLLSISASDSLGHRLAVGQRTLDPLAEVRILVPQPYETKSGAVPPIF